MDADEIKRLAAEMSAECANHLREEYPQKVVEAFALAGKYITVAALKREDRVDCSELIGPDRCPLCQFHLQEDKCGSCVLADPVEGFCGEKYERLLGALKYGTSMDVAHNIIGFIKEILK